jgi:hypothetical protein
MRRAVTTLLEQTSTAYSNPTRDQNCTSVENLRNTSTDVLEKIQTRSKEIQKISPSEEKNKNTKISSQYFRFNRISESIFLRCVFYCVCCFQHRQPDNKYCHCYNSLPMGFVELLV